MTRRGIFRIIHSDISPRAIYFAPVWTKIRVTWKRNTAAAKKNAASLITIFLARIVPSTPARDNGSFPFEATTSRDNDTATL